MSVFDVAAYEFFVWISAGPLLHVAASPHDAFSLFEDRHQFAYFFGAGLSDGYHIVHIVFGLQNYSIILFWRIFCNPKCN
jgi:hypothetical protein